MSQALIGLLGALVGAAAATATAMFIERRRSHDEDRRWLRSTLDEAYQGAILNLLRIEGLRSGLHIGESGKTTAILKGEDVRRWFDAVIDARNSLERLVVFSSDESRDEVARAEATLDHSARGLFEGNRVHIGLMDDARELREALVRCARRDLRRSVTLE